MFYQYETRQLLCSLHHDIIIIFLFNTNWQAQQASDDDFIVVRSYIKHII